MGKQNCISSSIHSEPGFCSPPLSATQVVGGDWTTITPDEKQLRLDVRSVVVTEDGAHVSIAFAGIVKIDDAIAAILQGKEEAKSTEFGSVVTNNSFKTGDERWMWMQDEYFVGAGRFVVDKEGLGVEYNVAQVMAGVQES